MFVNRYAFIGSDSYCYPYFPADLLFTPYYRRVIIIIGRGDRRFVDVQLGICPDTDSFFIQEFVRRPRPEELKASLFDGKYYNLFRKALRWVLRHRTVAVASLIVLLFFSAWSFKYIPKVFVPALDKQYFTVDMWLPEGTAIEETDRMAGDIADYIRGHEETEMVSSYIGRTPPRYYLSNISFGPQSNYAQLLVKCKSSKESRTLNALLQDSIRLKYPEPLIKVNKFELSPLTEAMIEARFLGPDPAVLDSLTGVAIEIMRRNPKVADARNEWGNMTMVIRPVYDPVKAGVLGITKAQMMESVNRLATEPEWEFIATVKRKFLCY